MASQHAGNGVTKADTIPQRIFEKLQAELKLKQKGTRSMYWCRKETVLLILINCESRRMRNVSFLSTEL
ncbi:hypothetical protein ANTQUA_LOCUS3000 [Anthophora quadrimaculata]